MTRSGPERAAPDPTAAAAADSGAQPVTPVRRVAATALIGSVIEWYDFFLYGAMAAVVFNQVFFPTADPLVGTLVAFATFGVGFVARPIGGIVLGNYGDKLGRRTVLMITLLIMGIATTLMGLIPSYDVIGIWAPALLVVFRLLQGFGAGAEFGGATLMSVEYASPSRRGLTGSLPAAGVMVGLLLATGAVAAFSSLPEEQFLTWGWRIPFLFSFIMVGVGLYLRARINETPAFANLKQTHTEVKTPVLEAIRTEPKNVLVVVGGRMAEHVVLYLYAVFMLTYVSQQLDLPRTTALVGVVIAGLISLATVPLFGALTDRVGRRPVYIAGAVLSALSAFPIFWLVNTESTALIWLALTFGIAVGWAAMVAAQCVYFNELFPARLRYSGSVFGREIASIFAGALAPLVATALLAWAGGAAWPIAVYIILMSLITALAVYLGPETYRRNILK
ncbi:metabolite-proton symporter [Halopolyspora algeriensis]|uniref:Putative proline/betaine transporter n=1 Tax=Halopolyspora algeriensis TaxID=1500506 RepID=A0A368VIH0_9ACTN|nr:MFS transporter [Halopolyspora algeriensis]RCW41057.1 metabolite-proton symporter [Halopolyspora algeriensis]TQM53859.1 metabolite-proton symporter [Halopolyspora algeriensis]